MKKMLGINKPLDEELSKKIDEQLDKVDALVEKYDIYQHEAQQVVEGKVTLNEVLKNSGKQPLVEDIIKDEKLLALANYLGVDFDKISNDTYDPNVYETEDAEYLVCNYDEAVEYATQDIEGTFDDLGLEAFTPNFVDWIVENALYDDWFESLVREEVAYQFSDMDDEEIADEAISRDLVRPEEVYNEESDAWSPELREDVDFDELRNKLIEDEFYNIDDYVEYVEDMFGRDFVYDEVKSNPDIVDMEKVVNECIRWDGIAHFISHYDGQEIELGNGLYAYRLN